MENKTSKKYEIGYKGFRKGFKCMNKQYEIGKTEKEDVASLCENGMHYCLDPLDVLSYYGPYEENEYAIINALKVPQKCKVYYLKNKKNKKVTTELTPIEKYDIDRLIYSIVPGTRKKKTGGKRIDDHVKVSKEEKTYNYNSNNSVKPKIVISEKEKSVSHLQETAGSLALTTSKNSISSMSDTIDCAAVSLASSSIAAAKDCKDVTVLANSNDSKAYIGENVKNGKAITTKEYSSLECHSDLSNNIMIGLGERNIAKGKKGNWIILAEYNVCNGEIKNIKSVKIDGRIIKEDTYYVLHNGKFIEIERINSDN